MTYTHALRTDTGWCGIVTADADGLVVLYESASVHPTEDEAAYAAMREFWDAIDAARFESVDQLGAEFCTPTEEGRS